MGVIYSLIMIFQIIIQIKKVILKTIFDCFVSKMLDKIKKYLI